MRLMKKCAAVLAAMIIAWSAAGSSAHAADKTVGDDEEIITATGYGYGPEGGNIKDSFYKTYARQAARLDALRNLIENMEIHVLGDDEKRNIHSPIDFAVTRASSKMLKNVWQVGEEKWEDDGMVCEVTMATTVKILKD